jgi:putative tryptophan/tyrosine transport system substrate-binding protein
VEAAVQHGPTPRILAAVGVRRLLSITLLLLATPTLAQEKVWRLGVLTPASLAYLGSNVPGSINATTLPVLAEAGFVEGKNLKVVRRAAEDDPGRLPDLARELAEEHVDVVIAIGGLAAKAVMIAAPSTPTVLSFTGADPVEAGLARSFARPGGKVTGIFFRGAESDAKRLELLAEAMPSARHLGLLAGPTLEPARTELLARTAARLGVALTTRMAAVGADYADAFAALKAVGAAAVLIPGNPTFSRDAPIFAPIAARHGLPTICEWDYMARQGCVFGFGPDLVTLRRRTGDYVVRILKGADPAELPIEQPDRFTLAVNLGVAAKLGLALSPSFLARADEVIE